MKITDFDLYRDLLKEKSGLALSQDQSYLLESRLNPIAKKWGYSSLDGMTMTLQGVADPELIKDIVQAMTSGDTSFFRIAAPMEIFKTTVMSYIRKNRSPKKPVKIWCAACSSGQEPYAIAIVLKEMEAQNPGWKFDIFATDISADVLEQAREAKYTQFEAQRGLPIQLLMKYFTQSGDKWQLNAAVRKMVRFDEFNLLHPMTKIGKFDIVLCRNVLSYFDDETKALVLDNITKQMEPDGFLFLGHKETVLNITETVKPVPGNRELFALEGSVHLSSTAQDDGTQALA